MTSYDTTLGGPGRSFPTTHWSQILAAQDGARDRLDALFRAYWKPAYAYIRVGWRKSNEDAKDLTQAFFARLLQNGRIAAVQQAGGRFRSYLKQALKNFLVDAERSAEVRRPVEAVVAVEAVEVATGATPESAFDREWLACLLETSLARLEDDLKKSGKEAYANVFRTYLLDPGAVPTYASVAQRWNVSESDVRNYLSQCRARLRHILKAGIRDTVENPADVEDELRSLLNE